MEKEKTGNNIYKEPIRTKTPGGMDALLVGTLYVRNSITGMRLADDDETYEEYKLRQKYVKAFLKSKRKGILIK